jgi:hypothetical protein
MYNNYFPKSIALLAMFFITALSFAQVTNTVQNTQYTTISAAIAAAQPGDVIQVAAGTYTGDLTINKSITIQGPNAEIAGTGTRNAEAVLENSKITFSGSINALFKGFKIYQTNNTTETVTISATSSVTFKNNILERFGITTGTVARAVYTNTNATGAIIIDGNKFTGDDSGNLFSGHKTWQAGIWTSGNTNIAITNNYFEHCRSAMNINPMSAGVNISGNTFTDNGQHITFGGTPNTGSFTLGANEFGITRDGIINLSGLAATFKLNITTSTFNGQAASDLSLAQQMVIESAMYHKGRGGRNGIVYFVPNQVYVVNGVSGTIQQAIDHATAGNIINIGEGTYTETMNVNKTLTVVGANPVTTIINPPSTGGGASVSLNANNIYLTGITVTRSCPDLNSWLAATKNNGILVGQNRSGIVIDNVIVKRNRNGIYWAKSQVMVTNCLIEENRTGFNIDGNLTGTIITNNIIRNNLTHGIAFNNNTNNIINLTNVVVSNNSITGNYHSNIAFLDDNGFTETGTAMATCNWFGTAEPVTNAATTTEPGYTAQIPGFFGGTIPPAPIDGDLAGQGIANVIATPHLTLPTNQATGLGFSGDLESCDAITTAVIPSQCGVTMPSFTLVFANAVNGATAYRFRANNGVTTQIVQTTENSFNLSDLGYNYETSYTIDVSAFVNGAWTIYGSSCVINSPDLPVAQLAPVSCNATNVRFGTHIFATRYTGIQMYRFRVVSAAQGEQIFDSPTNFFKLNQLPAYSYMTTYTIEVALFNNGVWSDYGPACTVSTPEAIPVTQLMASSCGITVPSFNTNIFCNTIPNAQTYRFRVTSVAQGTQFYDSATNYFKLNQLAAYTYNTAYTIDVAVQAEGEWSEYGSTCIVNTLATPPVTSLRAADCGATIPTRNTVIYANTVQEVAVYRFRVVSPGGTQTIDRPVNYFKINMLSGILAGQTMTVDVMTITANGIQSSYGSTCNITLSASATRMSGEDNTIVSAKTYPNPFVEGFTVQMDTESAVAVTVDVFDMNGRRLENFTAQPAELGSKEFGTGYAAGIYNIIVTQGTEQKVLHVVKN